MVNKSYKIFGVLIASAATLTSHAVSISYTIPTNRPFESGAAINFLNSAK